jgi:AraC-like DNA-binding protein
VIADGSVATRSWRHVRGDGLDHWTLCMTLEGGRAFRFDREDRCVTIAPRRLSVISLDSPYQARRGRTDWLGLFIPRGHLPQLEARFQRLRERPLDDAMSNLLARYLVLLWERLPQLTQADLPGLAEAVTAMVEACIRPTPDTMAAADTELAAIRRAQVLAYIRRQPQTRSLSPDSVARALGMSRSALYRDFEPEGGLQDAIQEQRLRTAARLLSDSTRRRTIAEIADAVGFGDAAKFSRAFHVHFEATPAEWRGQQSASQDDEGRVQRLSLADFLGLR